MPDIKFQCQFYAPLTYIIIYDIDIAIKTFKENIMKLERINSIRRIKIEKLYKLKI